MNELLIKFDNYKLFENEEFKIPANASIVIAEGDNETGKTSLITAIAEAYSLDRKVLEPLRHDADKGRVMVDVIDKNGDILTIVQELYRGKSSKFYAIKDGKKINEQYKITELLGKCTMYSIPEISNKLKSEKTRKETIREILTPLISADKLKRLEYLEAKNAQLYEERRDIGRTLEQYRKTLATVTVDDGDKALLEKEKEVNDALTYVEDEKKRLREEEDVLKDLSNKIAIEEQRIESEKKAIETRFQMANNRKQQIVTEIQELKAKIDALEKEYRTLDQPVESKIDDSKLKALRADLAIGTSRHEEHKAKYEENLPKYNELERLRGRINEIKSKLSALEPIRTALKDVEVSYNQKDSELEMVRKEIKEIYDQSQLPADIQIIDGNLFIDNLPFDENQISESKLMLNLVELLCKVNTARFINAGKYSDYNKERYLKLLELAKKHGKTVFLENVVISKKEVSLTCIVNEDQPDLKGDSEELLNKLD